MVTLVRDETESTPKAMELWQVFKLSREQRDALASELQDLFKRYAKGQGGSETILAHAAFAPRLDCALEGFDQKLVPRTSSSSSREVSQMVPSGRFIPITLMYDYPGLRQGTRLLPEDNGV